jgi:hypothetical protein
MTRRAAGSAERVPCLQETAAILSGPVGPAVGSTAFSQKHLTGEEEHFFFQFVVCASTRLLKASTSISPVGPA